MEPLKTVVMLARWHMAIISVFLAVCALGGLIVVWTQRVTCASFSTQEVAQRALWAHPALDGDRDGIACDELLKK